MHTDLNLKINTCIISFDNNIDYAFLEMRKCIWHRVGSMCKFAIFSVLNVLRCLLSHLYN